MGDGLLEDLVPGGNHVKEDGVAASTLSVDSYPVGVATEVVDVVFDPFQGLNLIQETDVVIRKGPAGEVGVGEESKSGQTVAISKSGKVRQTIIPGYQRYNLTQTIQLPERSL